MSHQFWNLWEAGDNEAAKNHFNELDDTSQLEILKSAAGNSRLDVVQLLLDARHAGEIMKYACTNGFLDVIEFIMNNSALHSDHNFIHNLCCAYGDALGNNQLEICEYLNNVTNREVPKSAILYATEFPLDISIETYQLIWKIFEQFDNADDFKKQFLKSASKYEIDSPGYMTISEMPFIMKNFATMKFVLENAHLLSPKIYSSIEQDLFTDKHREFYEVYLDFSNEFTCDISSILKGFFDHDLSVDNTKYMLAKYHDLIEMQSNIKGKSITFEEFEEAHKEYADYYLAFRNIGCKESEFNILSCDVQAIIFDHLNMHYRDIVEQPHVNVLGYEINL